MASQSGRLIRNIKYYTFGTFATKVLSLLLIPLYSKFLLTETLGSFQYIVSIVSLIIPVLYQSIWEGMFRYSIINEGNEYEVINTALRYSSIITAIYLLIFGICASIFHIPHAFWIAIFAVVQSAVSYWQFASRALKENKIYATSSIYSSIVTIFCYILFIVILKWQIEALFLSSIIGMSLIIIMLESRVRLIKNAFNGSTNVKILKDIIKYSIPLAINSISWWLISSSCNVIVTNTLGSSANGIMAMAQKFGTIFVMLTTVLSMAWQEESFRTLNEDNRDEYFNKVLRIYSKSLFSAVVVLIPLTFIIYKYAIFGDYKTGVILTSFMYLVGALNAIITHLGSAFLARAETGVLFWTTLLAGFVSVVLSLILVKTNGLVGVQIATVISCVFNFVIRIFLLKNRIALKINYFELIIDFLVCVLIAYICSNIINNVLMLVIVAILGMVAASIYNHDLMRILFKKVLNTIIS